MRLFVAIELSEAVRAAMERAQQSLANVDRQVRWTPPEQLHLTLKFLGEVADASVPAVCDAGKQAVAGVSALRMSFAGFGCFPPGGRVRIVWAGLSEPSGELARCQDSLDGAFEAFGVAREQRAYSPHVTIGRVREDSSGGGLRRAVAELSAGPIEQVADSIVMMQSVVSRGGAVYTPIARWPLAAPRA